jgi:hypothetical protein
MSDLYRRSAASPGLAKPEIARFRAQHLSLARATVSGPFGPTQVVVNEQESPLAWLARRRGRDGRGLIEPHHLLAGERLRADVTMAQVMPRTGMNWDFSLEAGTVSGGADPSESMIAARQRVHRALDAAGPEVAGLLLDVCCFLKRLEDVERERVWPARSAKIVLQLALERLARHYGYAAQAVGRTRPALRTWTDDREEPAAE